MKVIVFSETAGYMFATLENGLLVDELGDRPDLEGPLNDQLIKLQLEGEN